MSSHFTSLFLLVIGAAGLLVCIPALLIVWLSYGRITSSAANLFGVLDEAIVLVDKHVETSRQKVLELQLTTDDLTIHLKDHLRAESIQKVVERYEVDQRAERFHASLEQVGQWITALSSSVDLFRDAFAAASESGLPVSVGSADRVLQDLESINQHVATASRSVEKLRQWAVDAKQGSAVGQEAVELVGRLALTLTSIDDRCQQLRGRIDQLRNTVRATEHRSRRLLRWMAIGATVLLVWVAAGQAALCKLGVDGLRHSRQGTPTQDASISATPGHTP